MAAAPFDLKTPTFAGGIVESLKIILMGEKSKQTRSPLPSSHGRIAALVESQGSVEIPLRFACRSVSTGF